MSDQSPEEKLAALTERVKAQEALILKLIDIMVNRGDLTEGHRKILMKTALASARKSLPQIHIGSAEDKYTFEGADIDCASRLHLCGARCCQLEAPLGIQDIEEGKLEWETSRPYIIKRAEDGYCSYLADSGGCGCYEIRPTVCRKFDCRNDPRIWKDFEKRIATEEISIRIYQEPK